MMARDAQRGMTLLEVLIALTIFVLMAGAGYTGLQQALAIQDGLNQNRQYWRRLDTVMTLLQQDLDQTVNLLPRIPLNATRSFAGSSEADPAMSGDLMLFSRGGHASYGSGPVSPQVRVAWRLREGTLYRVIWPRLNMPETEQGTEFALIDSIAEIQLRYLDGNRRWRAHWPFVIGRDTPALLPRAVEFNLRLEDGSVYERMFHVGAG